MIKVSLNEILNAIPVFNELANKNFKSKVSFRIARMINVLNTEMKIFDTEREKMIMKYCVKDEFNQPVFLENDMVKIQEDKIEECNSELKELLNTQIDLNIEKLNEEIFDEAELTPNQVMLIMAFVE